MILVVVYHLFPASIMRSGFVGVDVFFVISGFLITSLLLRERERTGSIALVDFWRRRARRLLPALAVLVTVTATWAWMLGGDVLVRLGRQVLGAATFSYNWVSVAGGGDYFSADTPELLRNLWSLAVEEQFYAVWPLLLLLLLLVPTRWVRAVLAIAVAALSAWWMAELVGSGLTRAYFGTDSHAFGLLLGVALAFVLQRVVGSDAAWLRHPVTRRAGTAIGFAAIAALVVVATLPERADASTFPGTLVWASALTGVVIAVGVAPGSWIGEALDTPVLRWIGDRSYGIYLWHWPLFVLVVAMAGSSAASTSLPWWIGPVVLMLTLAVAAASFRFVEQPIRRRGLRASGAALLRRLAGAPAMRLRAAGVIALAAVVVAGTTAAISTAPEASSGQDAVRAGQRALAESTAPRPPLLPDEGNVGGTATDAITPTAVEGRQIDAIGDSVMLASAPALVERFPGIRIDAAVSRSMYAAPRIVAALADRGQLRRFVVLGLGTNGEIDDRSLDLVRRSLGPDRQLILVTASAPRSWIPDVNRDLRAYASAHADVALADWDAAIRPHRDLLAGDEIHPGEAGGAVYARALADTIAGVQLQRAQQRERMVLRACRLAAAA